MPARSLPPARLLFCLPLGVMPLIVGCGPDEGSQVTFASEAPEERPSDSIQYEYGGDASAAVYIRRAAMELYAKGEVGEAVAMFDDAIEKQPSVQPFLWQRGIALYQLGRFEDAAKQFESHQSVNGADVENVVWHLASVARSPGETIESARERIIEIDVARDSRPPMDVIHDLFAGTATEEDVREAAEEAGSMQADFYADLYIALYREAAGDEEGAKEAIRKACSHSSDLMMVLFAQVHRFTVYGEGEPPVPPDPMSEAGDADSGPPPELDLLKNPQAGSGD